MEPSIAKDVESVPESLRRDEITAQVAKPFGEKRGERKRARAAASKARREAREQAASNYSQPPATTKIAAARWDEFYETKPTLFKDRHLLRAEFPELMSAEVRAEPKRHVARLNAQQDAKLCQSEDGREEIVTNDVRSRQDGQPSPGTSCDLFMVEVGCGTGNGVYPILRANSRMFAYAFDFSQKAVDIVKSSSEYREDRIFAFQADLTDATSYTTVIKKASPDGIHFVTALWTFSALPPGEAQQTAAQGLADLLKDDGLLFIRDYATGDMREAKFSRQGQRVPKGNSTSRLFLRGDGTYAYFFESQELRILFENAGLKCETCDYVERVVENRRDQITMRRRWLQAKFRKTDTS